MLYMLMRHKVKDYRSWKRIYDAHVGMREKAGLTEKLVLQGEDDPHEVIILQEATDLGRAKAFVESGDLRDKMKEAGVIDKPDVYFLHDEAAAAKKVSGF